MRTADVIWKWFRPILIAVFVGVAVHAILRHAHASDDFAYRVKCEHAETTNHGTAAAISSHQLVTAAHVIKDADEIFIDHPIGWIRCKVVKIDESNDIAIIECLPVELHFVPLDTTAAKAGEAVTVCASVAGTKIRSLDGVIRKLFDAHRWLCDVRGFGQGGSGGPVIHDSKLIGVATALEGDTHHNAIANTCIFVCADCVQRMLAPETFEGEALPKPKSTAEVVLPPSGDEIAIKGGDGGNEKRTIKTGPSQVEHLANPLQGTRCLTCDSSQAHQFAPSLEIHRVTCTGGHCGESNSCSGHGRTRADTCPVVFDHSRHWDSDEDGHGQGGWVRD